MGSLEQAVTTQLKNIEIKTGKSLEELVKIIQESGLTRHAEIRTLLMDNLRLGYGDANALVHYAFQSDGERAAAARGLSGDDVLGEVYSGAKAALRPIHDRLMARIQPMGEFEIVPKKGYVSLRRKKQFAMLGPATNTRVEVGINVKNLEGNPRLKEMPSGSMCNYTVRLGDESEVDDELIAWIEKAYAASG